MTDSPNSVEFADFVIRNFLFGSGATPDDKASERILVLPETPRSPIQIDTAQYMETVGRFALLSEFPIVKFFFENFANLGPKSDGAGGYTFYTKADIGAEAGLDFFALSVQQYDYADDLNDLAVRTLIWNSVSYSINDGAQFWVHPDGRLEISNARVLPSQLVGDQGAENYDFASDDFLTLFANSYLQEWQDPNAIGRRVDLLFDNNLPPIQNGYGAALFDLDRIRSSGWTHPGIAAAAPSVVNLVVDQFNRDVSRFVDQDGRLIIYGSHSSDSFYSQSSSLQTQLIALANGANKVEDFFTSPIVPSLYLSYLGNGLNYVLGQGADFAAGSANGDRFLSGDGADTLYGEGGDDEFILGEGSKFIDGGDGVDTVRYLGSVDGALTVSVFAENDQHVPGRRNLLLEYAHGDAVDTFVNVEAVKGSDYADTIKIFDLNFNYATDVIIDLGGTSLQPDVADTLDLSGFSQDTLVDLRASSGTQILTSQGISLSFLGVEGVIGGAANDIIYAGDDGDDIRGGGGSDTLYGGQSDDRIIGGFSETADDGAVDTLYGGGGTDEFFVGVGDIIMESDSSDLVRRLNGGSGGFQARSVAPPAGANNSGSGDLVIGGERTIPPANPCAPGSGGGEEDESYKAADGTIFELVGSTLQVSLGSTVFFVENFRNGDGGIRLKETRPETDQAECQRDPLIIDLDGDRNVVRELFDSTAYFDLDNDGFRERVAWSLSGDGFLVRDRNGNGQIDDGSELFGSGFSEFNAGGQQLGGTAGFAELTTLDSNVDGVIDASDTGFASLKVWIDANGDAITDEGELKTLAELGLVSISLRRIASDVLDCGCDGTVVSYRSNVVFADGSSRSMYDAYLSLDQYDTREIVDDVDVPADFADLPFLIGTGTLSDLDVAMARDPALEEMVRAFAALTSAQAAEIGTRIEQIILRWTGADTVAADGRGPAVNGRQLRAIEVVSGSNFQQAAVGSNPRGDAATIIIAEWNKLVGDVTAKLLGQTALGQQLLPGLRYEGAAFYTADGGATVASALAQAVLLAPTAAGDKLRYWHSVATSLMRYANALGTSPQAVLAALDPVLQQQAIGLNAKDLIDAIFATSASGGLVVDSGTINVNGKIYPINRVLVAAGGDARLDGGGGDDRYIVTADAGSVSIVDMTGRNSVDLQGWNHSQTTATTKLLKSDFSAEQGGYTASFELTLVQGESRVRLTVDFRNGTFWAGADTLSFDDGNFDVLDLLEFGEHIVIGEAGASFEFSGEGGDQFLVGRSAADTYTLNIDSGIDIIYESGVTASADDVLQIDALLADVTFEGSGSNSSNLIVRIANSGSAITIAGQFSDDARQIERFEFSDGSVLTAAQVLSRITTGTTGDDRIQGTAREDLLDGVGGSDILAGGTGNDTYVFRPGYGQLIVDDHNGLNHLRIEGAIDEDDLDVEISAEGLRVLVGDSGDTVLIRGNQNGRDVTVELNGETINLGAMLLERSLRAGTSVNGRIDGTAGNDTLVGGDDAELIVAGGGRDWLRGGLGNDTYSVSTGQVDIYDTGFGFDRVLVDGAYSIRDFEFVMQNMGSTVIRFRLGGTALRVDLANRFDSYHGTAETSGADIEQIVFADGYVIDLTAGQKLVGGAGNDVLFNYGQATTGFRPGAGNDYIFAPRGGHELLLEQGFGHDIFYSSGVISVDFSGIALDGHVSFERIDYDLVIKVADGADSLTLKNAFGAFTPILNGRLEFDNDQIWLDEVVNSITVKTSGDDLLWGRAALDGGAGNDVLIGSAAPNNYVFARGYGHDVIKEQDSIFGSDGAPDTLTLVGLNPGDVSFARDASDPLSIVMTILDTGETLTLDGTPFDSQIERLDNSFFGGDNGRGDRSGGHWIDQIIFANGTVLSQRDVEQAIIDAQRTAGSDTIENFGSPLEFGPSIGAVLDGGAGNDRYVNRFNSINVALSNGTGLDRLINLYPENMDIVVTLAGLAAADVVVLYEQRDGQPVTVLRAKSGEELIIDGRPGYNGFELIIRDGVNGPFQYFNYRAGEGALVGDVFPAEGVDYLNGEFEDPGEGDPIVHDDIFNPGKGDDIIAGRGGNDTLIFNQGDGADRLLSFSGPATYTVSLGAGISAQDFSFAWLNDGTHNVRLSFNDQGDSITVDAREIGKLVFHDRTVFAIGQQPGISLYSSEPSPFNEASNDLFSSESGNAELSIGAASGDDRFVDLRLLNAADSIRPPIGWQPNRIILEGGVSLDDFEFVRDSDASGNLVIRNLLTGSSLIVEGQFDSEARLGSTVAWFSPDIDGNGTADWATMDLDDSGGAADFSVLDSGGDGIPDWSSADFDGDGHSDWQPNVHFTLDVDADGDPDVEAYDDNGDGTVDSFYISLTPTVSQPDIFSVTFLDTDGDNFVDEYTTDFVTFTPLPLGGSGEIDWGSVDVNGDGIADIAVLDPGGDGTPDWLAADLDGDGQSDWHDETDFFLYDANGNFVAYRYVDILTGDSIYTVTAAEGSILARDVDGDGVADQVGIDADGDLQVDLLEPYYPVGTIGLRIENPDGSSSISYWNWNDIASRLINRAEGTESAPLLDLLSGRPPATVGNDVLVTKYGENVDGLAGNDSIYLFEGGVSIRFGRGSGNDSVFFGNEWAGSGSTIHLDDLHPSDIDVLRGSGNDRDLVIRIRDTGEQLRIVGQWSVSDPNDGNIETFIFADGLTLSDKQILSLVSGESGVGDDTITTGSQGGVLNGGTGNDVLAGGAGNDFYEFGRGGDEDVIRDAGGLDTVSFASGISFTDLFFSRAGQNDGDLLIEVVGRERLALTIAGQFLPGSARVENFQFSDGRIFGWDDIEAFILDRSQTSGDDIISGFLGDDVMRGLAGNDMIGGGWGNDVIDGGAGRDTARYRGARADYNIATVNGVTTVTDLVAGRDGVDVLTNVEALYFAGGSGTTVSLVAENSAPVASGMSASTAEDSELVIARSNLMALASDADGDSLLLSIAAASNGRAWIDLNGDIRFRPDANFKGDASFDYKVADGNGGTATARVTVAVASVNDAPVVTQSFANVTSFEDRPVAIQIPQSLFSDIDGDNVAISIRQAGGAPLPAWLSFSNGLLAGTPPLDFNGTLDFEIVGSDGALSATLSFQLVITPLNDAPTVVVPLADLEVEPGDSINVEISTANFVDVEGDSLAVTLGLSNGEPLPAWLSYANGALQGTVPAGFEGPLYVSVTASDGRAWATDIFAIGLPGNANPVAGTPIADVTLAEDAAVSIIIPANAFSDPDGDALTLSASLANGDPLPTWLAFDGEAFSGQPPSNFHGTVELAVTASDGVATASQGFTLTFTPVNDAPVLSGAIPDVSVAEDSVIDIFLPPGTFVDADGDELTLSARLANGNPLPSWLVFDGARFTGQPPINFHGSLNIEVTGSDGTLSVADVFQLEITPVNDAPTLANTLADVTWTASGAINVAIPTGSFADIDGDTLTLSAKLANGDPLPLWLSFDGSQFTGTPPSGFDGFLDIEVTTSDGALMAADVFRLTVDVDNGSNDAPVLDQPQADVSAIRGQNLLVTLPSAMFIDADGDTLTYAATMADGSALPAWLSFASGQITGTIAGGALGDYNIRITASDGTLSASDTFTLKVGMLATGPERTPSQWALFGAGNDRVVGRGAVNGSISTLEGDDYITVDGWAMSVSAGDGNDIIEFMGDSGSVAGDAGADTFIFDGFSLLGGDPTATWTTITDFQNGVDRIGIVNGTGGIDGFSDLSPYMVQNGANVDIALEGLPVITIDNILLADLDASDFMFGSWLTDGGFGAAPTAGSVPYPTTTIVKTFAQRDQLGNSSERVLAYGTSAVTVDAMDGNDHITSDGWNNTIYGGRGNDVIEIFGTNNRIMGGAGYDYFVFDSFMVDFDPWELTWATLTDYHDGADQIVFLNGMSGLNGFADLAPLMSQEGDDVRIAIADRPDIIIEDVALATLDASDFLFVSQPAIAKALRSNGAIRMGSTVGISTVTANGFSNVTISGTANGDILNFSAVDLVNIVRVQGADGDDIITGNASANIIWGGNGNDTLYGGDGNDNLVGDAGDDLLSGGAGTDIINGGTNIDTVDYSYAAANLTVSLAITTAQTVSAGDVDTITNVENLTGGSGNDTLTGTTTANTINGGFGDDIINAGRGNDVINGGSGSDQAVFAGVSTTYSIATSGGTVSIVDNATSADGNDGTDVLIGIEQLLFKNGVTVNITSPIILDLDGGGVVTLSASDSGSGFDMNGDGLGDDTSWMGAGEGMLFLDRDGNGTVSNGGEFSFINDVEGATSDLAGLRAFDSNGDGRLSSTDVRFADFKIWRDSDGDGVVGQGEILSLAGAGVQSLGLVGTAVDGTAALGDVVTINKGNFTRTDGTSAEFLDAAFTYFSGATPLLAEESNVRQPSWRPGFRNIHTLQPEFGGVDDWKRHQERRPDIFDSEIWSGVSARIEVGNHVETAALDQKLAAIIQEMASFGAPSAGEGLIGRTRENMPPLDYFA